MMHAPTNRAVFLDRDGVLVEALIREEKAYSPRNLEEFRLVEGIHTPLQHLYTKGFFLIVVTNQPDLARGQLTWEALEAMHQKLRDSLGDPHLIHEIYVCPHSQEDPCECRKPKPGMLLRAASDWNLDLKASYLIGDREVDMEAAKAVGTSRILVQAPYNTSIHADYRAVNLADAAGWILRQS